MTPEFALKVHIDCGGTVRLMTKTGVRCKLYRPVNGGEYVMTRGPAPADRSNVYTTDAATLMKHWGIFVANNGGVVTEED